MSHSTLLDLLQQGETLLADGAMGTELHRRTGEAISACFELLNVERPDVVEAIHRDYLTAGARLIETNTFGANRYSLAEHRLADRVSELNRAGVERAKQAIRASGHDNVLIAGAVGPLGLRTGPYGRISDAEAQAAFREQISALVEAGIDALLLETFSDHHEILLALGVIKHLNHEREAPVPVIAQMTFGPDHRTLLGFTPARAAYELHRAGADVLGVNCSAGPAQLARIVRAMREAVPDAYISAMPNAGFPESVGGRVMYPATADYFGDYALAFRDLGANIIGGCCGTTQAHIAAMHQALTDPARAVPDIMIEDAPGDDEDAPALRPTGLAERLAQGLFTVTVEVAPPRSANIDKLIRSARMLRDAGADVLDVADTPAARMRMSPWAVCHALQERVGIETVLHFPTRGRNLLRVQGDLLAAHALDLRNLFVTMGDPTRIGDYPDAMDQFDIAPSKLIALIKQKMNAGEDLAGSSIGGATTFTVGCALNMCADDLEREVKLTVKKLEAGADFALGQAVFEPEKIERFHEAYRRITGEDFKLPVLMGVMPLYNFKHAQFLHNEVPGIVIPDTIMQRMEDAGEEAPAEGVRIAQELMRAVQPLVQGAYIVPAFGRYSLAAEVISGVIIKT